MSQQQITSTLQLLLLLIAEEAQVGPSMTSRPAHLTSKEGRSSHLKGNRGRLQVKGAAFPFPF